MNFYWCIIIPVLAAIIGAILGWLLRNLSCGCDDEKNEIEKLKAKNSKLEADLKACLGKKPVMDTSLVDSLKAQNSKLEADLNMHLAKKPEVDTSLVDSLKAENSKLEADLKACLAKAEKVVATPSVEPSLNFDAAAAKAAIGKKVVADDLKVVEGIGPKIEQLFHAGGIKTWYQLSLASIEKCQAILDTGGKRYEIHNPSTWPKQAGLAFEGKWEELNTLQDRLDGGVDRG